MLKLFLFALTSLSLVLLAGCASGASRAPAPADLTPGPIMASSASSARDLPPPEPEPKVAPVAPRMLPEPWAAAPLAKHDRIPPPPINVAKAAVLLDEPSGAIIYDKNAHERLAPASLTKIATLILALERGGLDEWVAVDIDSRTMRGSSVMGLIPGDRFTLRDLLYGLMLPSGNDAALAIGRHISGSDAAFVEQMNLLSTRLGLKDTLWSNPHGLGGGPTHYSSAYDLAMLSRYGMTLPGFREISSAPYWLAKGERTLHMSNINTFLSLYRGADGTKTGYTRTAGSTLAASAWRDGHRIFAVILNSPSREWDAIGLLDWAFTNLAWARH